MAAGDAARWVAKYRPPVPVLVITNNARVVRQLGPLYGAHPYLVETIPFSREDVDFEILLEKVRSVVCLAVPAPKVLTHTQSRIWANA
jgi:pyruvate kinase